MKKRDAEQDTLASVAEDADKKKRNIDPSKLENMNKKLQAIEDFIINETIKYTGAHEGMCRSQCDVHKRFPIKRT